MIVPSGQQGFPIRTAAGQLYWLVLEKVEHLDNTVGTGEAVRKFYIQEIRASGPIDVNLRHAQQVDSKGYLEKLDFLLKLEAFDKFYHRHISDIPRIKFSTQRRGWAKRLFFKVA